MGLGCVLSERSIELESKAVRKETLLGVSFYVKPDHKDTDNDDSGRCKSKLLR